MYTWVLPPVQYIFDGQNSLAVEPEVEGILLTQYVDRMLRHVIAFVEELIAYAASVCLESLFVIYEISVQRRNPKFPVRFRLGLKGEDESPWALVYDDSVSTEDNGGSITVADRECTARGRGA